MSFRCSGCNTAYTVYHEGGEERVAKPQRVITKVRSVIDGGHERFEIAEEQVLCKWCAAKTPSLTVPKSPRPKKAKVEEEEEERR